MTQSHGSKVIIVIFFDHDRQTTFNKVFAAWENGALLSVQAKPAETALHRQQQTVNTS
jgi:hypothetical protein